MIIVCSSCATRLQLEDTKVPARPFALQCPKCRASINIQPAVPANDHSALALGESPSTEHPRFEQPKAAPVFKSSRNTASDESTQQAAQFSEPTEILKLLATALPKVAAPDNESTTTRPPWDPRRVLVCVTPENAVSIAGLLADSDYEVYLADDTTQAVERMRERRMDVVILDPEFDPAEQGAAFVTREVKTLPTSGRRRLFFVHLSTAVRTLDSHTAFLNNVNLVVNPADIENLPQVLDRAVRDFNELYRNFNSAFNIGPV